jgi:anti-sigma regulatory factor (Ser/Thr protein kinase)
VIEVAEAAEPLWLPVAADPAGLAALRGRLRGWLAGIGAPHRLMAAVLVAAEEAVNNAIEHGLDPLEVPETTRAGPPITLTASHSGAWIDVAVSDPGPWRAPRPNPPRGRGHGMALMKAMASAVSVETRSGRTTVRIRARLDSDEATSGGQGQPR